MTTNDILKRLCGNIAAGRFNWRKYCTPQSYFGWEICVTPLHCSYGQIGYTVHFPYDHNIGLDANLQAVNEKLNELEEYRAELQEAEYSVGMRR